ncbi:MAG TPA: diguanylate cyclase, partial [Minicystis sp.]|nr:diguanylate cyclase [Minicystis sp.]
MTLDRSAAAIAEVLRGTRQTQATVLAIVADPPTRLLFENALADERLALAADLAEGLAVAEGDPPDVAFIEIGLGDGAGLALVHHLKALVPSVTVFALAERDAFEQGAHAMALGAAGTLLLPVGGDEVLSAVATVKVRLAEREASAELERAAQVYARAAGWMGRVAELADATSRSSAASRLVEILLEATQARGAAVYLAAAERGTELVRAAASDSLETAPAFGLEADVLEHGRRERLLAVPLALKKLRAGHVLLDAADLARPRGGLGAAPRVDGLVKLLATQATTAFALLAERERAGGGAMKDPASSAYSFAYYVDVAGREIDRARRYGRRFAIATVAFDELANGPARVGAAEVADQILKSVRDTDMLARIDEHEFHLLLPETDGLGAHACRRRILARFTGERGAASAAGLLVGTATFPHDGQDLSQLLRVARRRAEATHASVVHGLPADPGTLGDVLDALGWDFESAGGDAPDPFAPRALELPTSEAVALASTVVADALRGGATFVAFAQHARLSLAAAVRATLGAPRDAVTVHAIDVKPGDEDIEALAILAEHGAYALIGRNEGGVVRGV